jgi:hypothetical protein
MLRLLSRLKVLALVAALLLPAAPALAGPAEVALLGKYEGSWKGTGKVTGPDPGTVVCRLTLKAASGGRFTYSGRCSFSSGGASFRGTLLYNDDANRFEASTSSTGISSTAIGRKQGGGVVFSTTDTRTQMGSVSSTLSLTGGKISMSFKLVDKRGRATSSAITFART